MAPSIRPEPQSPADLWEELVRKGMSPDSATKEVAKIHGPPAPTIQADAIPARPADPVDAYLKRYMTDAAEAQRPSTAGKIGSFLAGVVEAPIKSAFDAAITPGVGEARPDPRLSKGGNPSGAPIGGTYDAEHGAVTQRERANATAQTMANIAGPRIIGAMPKAGPTIAGAIGGAAYDPESRVRGALLGGGVGAAATAAPWIGGQALDAFGLRPRTYAGTPSLGTAITDVSDALSPGLATRDINNPPPANIGKRLLRSAGRAAGVESIEQRAVRKISEALEADQVKLQTIRDRITQGTQRNATKPETVMDLAGENVMGLGRGASMVPNSQAKSVFPQTLQDRALGQEERLLGDILQSSGQKGRTNIPRTMKALHDEAKAASRPFYQKLEEMGPVDMELAAQYFDRPAFKTAYAHAETVAANKGKTLPKLFDDVLDESGKVVGKKLRPMDFKTVDRVKRALDDVLFDSEKLMPSELASKAGGLSNEGRGAIEEARGEFLKIADDAFPGYKDARDAYAGPTALNRAVEKGKKILTMTPDEIGEYVGTLSKSELESFQRSGLETFMQRKIESVSPGNDATRGMSKTIDQKRLRHLFPDDESYGRFRDLVARESRMNQTRNFFTGQSKTVDKLAEFTDLMGISLDVASGNLGGMSKRLLQRGLTQRAGGVTAATADEIAKRLTAGANPQAMSFMNLLDEVNQYRTGAAPTRAIRKAVKGPLSGATTAEITKP